MPFDYLRCNDFIEGKEKYLEIKEFYNMQNIFFLSEEARWTYIMQNAKQDDIALKIDTALHNVEKNNPSLKGAILETTSHAWAWMQVSWRLFLIPSIDIIANENEHMGREGYMSFSLDALLQLKERVEESSIRPKIL
jgi:hypothetical protein